MLFQQSKKIILGVILTAAFIVAFQFMTYEHVSYIQNTIKSIHEKTLRSAQIQTGKIWEYYNLSHVPVERGNFIQLNQG